MCAGLEWPEGKRFAFTIFDDTDCATLENITKVYSLLLDLGLRTTKSVWVLDGNVESSLRGSTCEDPEYLAWLHSLQGSGFEIGFHGASYSTASRQETELALKRFREFFGAYPSAYAMHSGCREAPYWGAERVSGLHRFAFRLAQRGRSIQHYEGHVPGSPLFWGDLCQNCVGYMRNFVYYDINTLKCCPEMPYHDPERPFVRAWFASSDGARAPSFIERISEARQEQLEAEGGLCIMYTHLACGFAEENVINPRFRRLMERLAARNGWFVPVSTVLDYVAQKKGVHEISSTERRRLERRWILGKLLHGPS